MTSRPYNLAPWQVPAAKEGRLGLIVVPLKVQPEYVGPGGIYLPTDWQTDPTSWGWENHEEGCWDLVSEGLTGYLPFATGDELWCRDGWNIAHESDLAPGETVGKTADECARDNGGFATSCGDGVVYKADGVAEHPEFGKAVWRSPVTMPRWASRFTLRVTDASVKRVQEITEDEAVAAGCIAVSNNCPLCRDGICSAHQPPIGQFSAIHHPIWASNPWCAFGCVERMK